MVQSLLDSFFERADLQEALTKVYDMERLVGRVAFGNVNGRDLLQLKSSLEQVPLIAQLLQGINRGEWNDLLLELTPLDDLVALIEAAIDEDAPLQIVFVSSNNHKRVPCFLPVRIDCVNSKLNLE